MSIFTPLRMRILFAFLITTLSFFNSGCFWNDEEKRESASMGLSPKEFYTQAKELLTNGTLDDSIKMYEKLQAAYPASKYSTQAKIDIIYALYKAQRFDESINYSNNYLKLYPEHFSTPYIYYIRALSSEKKSHSILDKFITDHAQRDVSTVVDALNFYVDLIKKFPNSEYSVEAKEKLISLRNTLARHELFVAIFYTKKEAYIASINRCKFIIVKYPESPSVPAALHLMAYNYDKIDSPKLAMDARRVLSSSYPKYTPHYSLEN